MKATRKYRAKAYDRIELQVPKGTRDRWRALAEQEGKSLTAYIVSRVEGAPVPLDTENTPPSPASTNKNKNHNPSQNRRTRPRKEMRVAPQGQPAYRRLVAPRSASHPAPVRRGLVAPPSINWKLPCALAPSRATQPRTFTTHGAPPRPVSHNGTQGRSPRNPPYEHDKSTGA